MEIAIPLYDGFTALDAVGPYDVLSRIPGAEVKFVAVEPGPKRTENDMLSMTAEYALSEVTSPEVLVVPGGYGTRRLLDDEALLSWIRGVHETSTYTTSVCTGALLLGGAGLLDGLEATTHWASLDLLPEFGATPSSKRVVEQGKIITAAGVSAGIDMALTLVAKLFHEDLAKAIQLGIEYDPQPPFDCGSPEKAGPEMTEMLRGVVAKENEAAALRLAAAEARS
jgi:transcriptional regulator GlxA family with amidase domain